MDSQKNLILPYGRQLTNLLVARDSQSELRYRAVNLPSIQLSERSTCDLELLAIGAFSPLDRFMGREDYSRVLYEMQLASGHIFPIPITLPVEDSSAIHLDQEIALCNSRNELLGIMTVEEIFQWDLTEVAEKVFGTQNLWHPLVSEMHSWGQYNLSGRLEIVELPKHYDFRDLRLTPSETRQRLKEFNCLNVVAFQTRNPLHRVHEELTKRAIEELSATLLLHPVVGMTKPGDMDHYTRVRSYRALVDNHYNNHRVLLSLVPLAMRFAGPREALWHAVIRRNYGANHLIVGRDHASPGKDSEGKAFYAPYEAQELVKRFSNELGVKIVPFQEFVYLPDEDRYEERSKIGPRTKIMNISGTQVREEYLKTGKELPGWFTRPEVTKILTEAFPARHQQGVCLWFTGLSGAGKSTTAEVLTVLLLEYGRQVTVLDGDVVRTHLSKGLSFNKKDRDTNILRIGFVAAEIVHHRGMVICAAVSPYRVTRNRVRNNIGDGFVEVFVDTPLDVCEQRDTKGMYGRARRGEMRGFTGVDDPYEVPEHPEIRLETVDRTPEQNANQVIKYLLDHDFLSNHK